MNEMLEQSNPMIGGGFDSIVIIFTSHHLHKCKIQFKLEIMSRFIHEKHTQPSQGDSRVASQFESVHSISLACAALDGFCCCFSTFYDIIAPPRLLSVMTIYFILFASVPRLLLRSRISSLARTSFNSKAVNLQSYNFSLSFPLFFCSPGFGLVRFACDSEIVSRFLINV